MSIFQSVKVSVTARQAAEQYGVKVNRNGVRQTETEKQE